MTRRQICEAIGMTWRGPKGSMKANRPGGTWLAYLLRCGHVRQARRLGDHTYLYGLVAQRRKLGVTHELVGDSYHFDAVREDQEEEAA